jgi:hypothetical protein
VKDVAGFVGSFLRELSLLRPARRPARLLLFKRALHARALALIAHLNSIRWEALAYSPAPHLTPSRLLFFP